jgi:hypothetical protein
MVAVIAVKIIGVRLVPVASCVGLKLYMQYRDEEGAAAYFHH